MKQIKYIITLLILMSLSCEDRPHSNPFDPNYEGNEEVIIPHTTKIITKNHWQNYLKDIDNDSSTFTFSENIQNEYNIDENNVIVSSVGEGVLKKVTNVKHEQGNLIVTTQNASIVEAVRKGDMSFNSNITGLEVEEIDLDKGFNLNVNKLQKSNGEILSFDIDFILYDADQNYTTTGDQIILSGYFNMNQEINGKIDIEWFHVNELKFEYQIEQELGLELKIALAFLQWQHEKRVGHIKFHPITIMMGGFPVIITPVYEFFVGTEINIESNIETGVTNTFTYTTGIEYYNDQWSSYKNIEHNLDFILPTLSASATAKAYIKPALKFKVYGTVSPYLYGTLYSELDANINLDPWWGLYAGLSAGIGIKVDPFDHTILNFSTDIFDKRFTITEAKESYNTSPVASFTINPQNGETSTIFTFDASGSYDNEDPNYKLQFKWDWESDGYWDDYGQTVTHQFNTEDTYNVTLQVLDSGGLTDEIMKTVIVNNDNLEDVTVDSRYITIEVWDHSAEDGDQIDLTLNGIYLLENYIIMHEHKIIDVTLEDGKNRLVVHADNQGSSGPNTASIKISNVTTGQSEQQWDLNMNEDTEMNIIFNN